MSTFLAPANVARITGATGSVDQLPTATGVAFNSAQVRPGYVFVAMPGAATHGIRYAQQALDQGAAYILSDVPHPQGLVVSDPAQALLTLGRHARSQLRGPVVGITGTAGKTTTKALTAAALAAHSTPGNFNTPFALAQALIASLVAEEASGQPYTLVLELGIDHVGEMERLLDLTRPDHAVLTTIGASHLEGLGSVAVVAQEKALLLQAASGVRLVGAAAAAHLRPHVLQGVQVVTTDATLNGLKGSTLRLQNTQVHLPWPGRPVAEGAALALTMAANLGVPVEKAVLGLLSAELVGGRLEPRTAGSLTLIDDSYNSNPVSLKAALEVLASAPAPRVAFLGDMLELGEREEQEHLVMGEATVDLELVVAVGNAGQHVLRTNPKALWAPDSEAACEYLERIPKGATVLVKGSRGVRMERITQLLLELSRGSPASSDAHLQNAGHGASKGSVRKEGAHT